MRSSICWQVLGTLLIGASAARTSAQEIKPQTLRLPAPAKVSASQRPDGPIRVVWSSVDGAIKYRLIRSVPPEAIALVALPDPSDTQYVDSDVKAGRTYYYEVAALNEAGAVGLKRSAPPVTAAALPPTDTAKTEASSPSAPVLPPPTDVVAKPYPYRTPTVSWKFSATGVRFLVERRVPQSDPNAGWEKISSIWQGGGAHGLWGCCEAKDGNATIWEKDLVYRVTAVDTAATTSRSPAVLSNLIVNLPIDISSPVLNAFELGVGEFKYAPSVGGSSYPNTQWVSLTPNVASVDPNGNVRGLAPGQTYVVSTSLYGGKPYIQIWRVDVAPK